jgi:hypothetical protein
MILYAYWGFFAKKTVCKHGVSHGKGGEVVVIRMATSARFSGLQVRCNAAFA